MCVLSSQAKAPSPELIPAASQGGPVHTLAMTTSASDLLPLSALCSRLDLHTWSPGAFPAQLSHPERVLPQPLLPRVHAAPVCTQAVLLRIDLNPASQEPYSAAGGTSLASPKCTADEDCHPGHCTLCVQPP